MNILVLEDSPERIDQFKEVFRFHNDIYYDQATLAIRRLTNERFDLICLDHDLGTHDDDFINNGLMVARELPNTINRNTTIIIHSYNPIGAKMMRDVLPHAIVQPFDMPWLTDVVERITK
jgi:CheY-like chemotaxis protein